MMRVLVLGGGGREHALCWGLSRSPSVRALFCAPGNAGIAQVADCISIDPNSPSEVLEFFQRESVDLVVIGPEAPLEAGVSDTLREAGVAVFGPSKAAAHVEFSKQFTKDLCLAVDAPTAHSAYFTDKRSALAFARLIGAPIVVKADGLAAGKGVVVAMHVGEALETIERMFDGQFGAAGASVVLEEYMEGEEASLFVLTDGKTCLPLEGAQDHKRAYDGDEGPNTGGMGAYSPAPILCQQVRDKAMQEIIEPVLGELTSRGTPYQGVLYAGLMIKDGEPRLVEFNARFGDPECQVLIPRLKSDLAALLDACARGALQTAEIAWDPHPCVTVVMVADGYPASYRKGDEIHGLDEAGQTPGVTIFHAGTKLAEGRILTDGGRVLNITAMGHTIAEAQARAYEAIDRINWPGGFYRHDIAWRAV